MRAFLGCILFLLPTLAFAQTVNFEDLSLPPESFYNGSDLAGGFTSQGTFFNNTFTDFGGGFTAWSGFAYSNRTDVTTPGFGNMYSAYHLPGGGGDGSPNFALGFAFFRGEAVISWGAGLRPEEVRVTNNTWAALSMRDGDGPGGFAKQFGGPTGNDPDFFSVTFHGLDAVGASTGSVTFFLADYRFANNALDYIVDEWTTVDLRPLGETTRRIELEFASSDIGPFGMNTPAYAALDNLRLVTAVPEPATIVVGALALPLVLRWRTRRRRCQAARRRV